MNPFLPLRPLTPNVEHVIRELAKIEESLCDAGSTETRAKDILITWHIVSSEQTVDVGEVAS